MEHASSLPPPIPPAGHERLWTPWRMQYIGGGGRVPGCIFCDRLRASDDRTHLILYRGTDSFVIMNLYPYNTGHVMLVPNEHIASPESTSAAATVEMAALRGPLLRAFRRALSCQGFNLGLNVGAEAGAGIAAHMHEHVVPRWLGDANFMPILANTMVLPELLPVTYAKLRAELGSELHGTTSVDVVVLDSTGQRVLIADDSPMLTTRLLAEEPVWRSAANLAARAAQSQVTLAGWAGGNAGDARLSLAFLANQPDAGLDSTVRWRPVGSIADDAAAQCVDRAVALLTAGSNP